MTFHVLNGGHNGAHSGPQGLLAALSAGIGGRGACGGSVVVPFDGSLDQETGAFPLLRTDSFPDSAWDPDLRAQLLLADFAGTDWFDHTFVHPLPATSIEEEIVGLIADVNLREARLPEIIGQADDFTSYWCDLLMVTPSSRPKTWLMILAMLQIGTLVAMKFKKYYAHPRPVQLYPALMPCILTPGHPSFPSSHALQCHLMADFLSRANPALAIPARNLANRIARNREIAGVHFPRDRVASRNIAEKLAQFLYAGFGDDGQSTKGVLDDLLADVAAEFAAVTAGPPLVSLFPAGG